ncbi:C40 family peptidase [Alicyclobacillus macrosporangiidus]|uniref:C40 family peptidase n=1 Tax=Alicyclobacillus macrosporangiidus TaxID=392015 RepID=UPI0009DE5EF7|nr:NlpC/P60 family protein [Alicyclobacillus macrosporangiidus]
MLRFTPYTFGGNDPKVGFDCSGFVQYVFSKNGISLPRSAHEQATVGTPVPRSQVQKGGIGVIVVHNIWSNPYYTSHYWGARRVIPQG